MNLCVLNIALIVTNIVVTNIAVDVFGLIFTIKIKLYML